MESAALMEKRYEGRGHKFPEYRALRYNFQACYSRPLKPSWRGNSHFRDWLPVVIGLFSEWRADVTVSFGRLDHYMPYIPGTFDRVLRMKSPFTKRPEKAKGERCR
jgi:hypothetical protein